MLTVILKGTSQCNLRCKYCSLGDKTEFHFADSSRMRDIMRYIGELCVSRKEKTVKVIFHGGEPLLIEPEIYDEALTYFMENYLSIELQVLMQTNGFVITDKALSLIKKWDICVGVSIDGPEEIHDLQRVDINGKPTHHKVTDNIRKLMDSGISVSGLMVLTKNAVGKGFDFLEFFAQNNIHLKINPLLNYGDAVFHNELTLSPGDYSDYLIEMFEYICDNDIDVTISPLDVILRAFLHNTPITSCTFRAECCKEFLAIDYNGDIFPCGKFSDISRYKLGTIYEPANKIDNTDSLKIFCERRTTNLPPECNSCRFIDKCHAGCSAEAVIGVNLNAASPLCNDYYKLFSYFESAGLKKLKEYLIQRKNKLISEMNKLGI